MAICSWDGGEADARPVPPVDALAETFADLLEDFATIGAEVLVPFTVFRPVLFMRKL
jgi:hypothetical protein